MEFSLLGPLQVRRSGLAVDVGGWRQRTVLAALVSRANDVASLPYLIETVWDKPPTAPESNIRTYICGLRRRLCRSGDVGRIVARDRGYVLLTRPGEVDMQVFVALAEQAEAAQQHGEVREAVDLFGQALALWRGRALEGLDPGARLRAEMTRLEDHRLYVAEQYARTAGKLRRYDDVVGVLRELVAEYPLREELWSELMFALSSSGRRADALDTYRDARARLIGELGLEPGRRLRQLHQWALTAGEAPSGHPNAVHR